MEKTREVLRPQVDQRSQPKHDRTAGEDVQSSEGLESGIQSLKKAERLAARLRERILDLAQKAGSKGLTINEAERQISDHKGCSVSPRFSELLKRGALVRIFVTSGRPTKRCPHGAPRCVTRLDEETCRNVNVH